LEVFTDAFSCSYAGVDAAASGMAAMDVSDQQEPGQLLVRGVQVIAYEPVIFQGLVFDRSILWAKYCGSYAMLVMVRCSLTRNLK
jgi:hypothetical protein